MKRQLKALSATLLITALTSFSAIGQQTKINLGYVPASDFLPALIAKDKGFFEKRNLDVTPTRILLAPNVAASIVSGSLQIGMSTGPILMSSVEAGLNLVAVAGASRFTKDNSMVSLVARSGLKVTNAADLRGKKVGVPGFNSFLHVIFQKWLIDNKVQPSQVHMVEASFPQMKDLLKGGTLDTAISIEPFRARILGDQTGVKVADFVGEVNPDILAAFWIADADWANKNRSAVLAFREALKEAIAFALKNPEDAKAVELKYLTVVSPVVPSYTADVSPADFEFIGKATRDLGMLRKPVEVNKLVWK
jgi:NitT/TauT family transport system substrate-binding protein